MAAVDPRTALPRPRSPGRPRKADVAGAGASRDRLLDAAIDLFARHGYDPVTTGAVAEAAGLTQSMVHYHYGSKAKLWEAAIDRLMRDRGDLFPPSKAQLAELEPMDRLRLLVRRLVEANAVQPNLARIAMHEGMAPSPRLDWLVERYMRAGYAVFDRAIEDAIASGALRPMPVHDVTNVVTSAASLTLSLGAVITRLYGHETRDPDRMLSFIDSLLHILFEGLRSRTGTPDRLPKPKNQSNY